MSANSSAFASAVQAVFEDVRNLCSDPADAVRLLSSLAITTPVTTATTAPIGASVAAAESAVLDLCTQAALTSLARACASYTPPSYEDAQTLLETVVGLFDDQIQALADAAQGKSYQAMRRLRTAVIKDLVTRGSQLPRLVMIQNAAPRASLVEAYRKYGDITRAVEMANRAGAEAPLFMPPNYQALNS